MKILYDCFSCSPYYGSDEGIGWNWPFYMSKFHEVWALVRKDRRADIEKYCIEHPVKNLHFIYADIPDWMNIYYKNLAKNKNGILDFLFYQWLWQGAAYRAARRAHKQIHFDLVHHCGTNDFRFIGKIYKLNIPFVIGPIGGAQETPEGLKEYTLSHSKSEKLRSLLNKFFTGLPGYKKALDKASKIYFSNPETYEYLKNKIKDKNKCEYMTEIACTQLPELKEERQEGQPVTFLWAGRMEYRKGLEFLFDVLERLPKDNSWQVILCGDGSERVRYERMCEKKGLSEYIRFKGKCANEEMDGYYRQGDAFVFPSLRETTGTVIIEAMAHSLPVICIKQGGGALIVTDDCGYPISGGTKEEYINYFKIAMLDCINHVENIIDKGKISYNKIKQSYMWEQKIERALLVYSEVTNDGDAESV